MPRCSCLNARSAKGRSVTGKPRTSSLQVKAPRAIATVAATGSSSFTGTASRRRRRRRHCGINAFQKAKQLPSQGLNEGLAFVAMGWGTPSGACADCAAIALVADWPAVLATCAADAVPPD